MTEQERFDWAIRENKKMREMYERAMNSIADWGHTCIELEAQNAELKEEIEHLGLSKEGQ